MARGLLTSSSPLVGLLAAPSKSGGVRDAKGQIGMAPAISTGAKEPERERRSGPGALDYVWGLLAGYSPNDVRRTVEGYETAQARAAQEQAQQDQAWQDLSAMFGGGAGQGGQAGLALAAPKPGAPAPVAPQGQQRRFPTLREAAPVLARAQLAGVDGVGGLRELLEATGPSISNINGFAIDERDPNNVGRYFPNMEPGQEPLFDQSGRVVGIRNMDGSVQAVAERERAISDARNASEATYAGVTAEATAAGQGRGSAPYETITVQGPDGAPITMPLSAFLQNGAIRGQSPAEGVRAEGLARLGVEREGQVQQRADSGSSQLASLDEMERLLPDVIAGFGAGARLAGNRALGALGNDDAQRRAAATEVFQNQGRQIVSQIIRTFGSNPTEGERAYAERMSGADTELTPEALREGMRLARQRIYRDMAAAGVPITVTSREHYNLIPSGAVFVAPDGSVRRKP